MTPGIVDDIESVATNALTAVEDAGEAVIETLVPAATDIIKLLIDDTMDVVRNHVDAGSTTGTLVVTLIEAALTAFSNSLMSHVPTLAAAPVVDAKATAAQPK